MPSIILDHPQVDSEQMLITLEFIAGVETEKKSTTVLSILPEGSGTPEVAVQNTSSLDVFPCQEDFFCPEGSNICVANCGTWSEFTPFVKISTDVVYLLSAIIGFITGIIVIILSAVNYKHM